MSNEAQRLFDEIAAPDHETGSPLGERCGQIKQQPEQERRTVRSRTIAVQMSSSNTNGGTTLSASMQAAARAG